MRLSTLAITLLMLAGCATTPLQRFSDSMDKLQSMPIHAAVDRDIDTAMEWAYGPDAPTDPEELFKARACPTALDFNRKGRAKDMAEIQELMKAVDSKFNGMTDGSSPTILTDILKLKYGKEKAGGPQARIAELKSNIFQRYIFARNSCAGLFSGTEQFGAGLALKFFGMP